MRNPLEWLEQRRARERYMPRARRPRSGRTAKVAAVALVVILAAAALLELSRGGGSEAAFVELARDSGREPLDLIENAARSRRLVFLSDIPSAPAPKRLAAQAIERIGLGTGLDLVVLDVDSNEQPYIDRYLATSPEDPSILLSRPRAVREGSGASREYLDIYRTVWRVNEQLGAARRIRIIAADAPGWPPERATSPADAARLFAERADHMASTVMERALARNPGARVLFLVDGLHALKSGGGRVQTGGAAPAPITWLAAQMRERFPSDVYSILVDAPPSRSINPAVAAYRGTAFADVLSRGGVPAGTALPVTNAFNDVSRSPIRTAGTTGIEFSLEPRVAPMSDLADAYIYFGG
ncbi:MAG TPA: hypothetical protein VHG09_10705 [Longimicrobiales bacterium]|nr:hypothetical protein [Longimicrobiales bacterium]